MHIHCRSLEKPLRTKKEMKIPSLPTDILGHFLVLRSQAASLLAPEQVSPAGHLPSAKPAFPK